MKDVKIFGSIVEEEARQQIEKLANYDPYKDVKIRIMPDVHAGKGCSGLLTNVAYSFSANIVKFKNLLI